MMLVERCGMEDGRVGLGNGKPNHIYITMTNKIMAIVHHNDNNDTKRRKLLIE